MFQQNPPRRSTLALSFGIEKAIIEDLSVSDHITDADLSKAVSSAFKLVHSDELVDKSLDKLLTVVLERIAALQPDPSATGPSMRQAKSLGTKYAEWLAELDATELCLYLTDYDIKKARHIYWFTDIPDVQGAVRLKSQHDSQLALIQMEAALYGGGGKYQDDDAGSSNYHDMNSAEGSAALKAFGF